MTVQTDGNGDWQAAADNILADGVYSVTATISVMQRATPRSTVQNRRRG